MASKKIRIDKKNGFFYYMIEEPFCLPKLGKVETEIDEGKCKQIRKTLKNFNRVQNQLAVLYITSKDYLEQVKKNGEDIQKHLK